MQFYALLTEAAFCYPFYSKFLLPWICLCWKFSSQMFSISWQCFSALPFFWKRDNARPMRVWPHCFLGAFYADFQQFALAVHNLHKSAKSTRAAWCFSANKQLKRQNMGYPNISKWWIVALNSHVAWTMAVSTIRRSAFLPLRTWFTRCDGGWKRRGYASD